MTAGEARPGPIVVGVDRSGRSRDALALARRLARATGARLLLVSVYPVGARSATIERSAYARALEEEAETALDWVAAPLTGARPEARAVPCTSISRGLQEIAVDEGALAIVAGPSHGGRLGRRVQGSVGERLLRGAPCPIVVATADCRHDAHDPIARIGVGYVASSGDEALSAAAGLAARSGAEVRVLSVVEPPVVGWRTGVLESTAREHLAARIADVSEGAGPRVQIAGEVVDGYADDELARLSSEVDLLVCGSSGHRAVGGVLAAGASADILRKARCALLMVPSGAHGGFAALRAPPAFAA